MAAIGFVVGVAWPRLAGVRLGPSVPDAHSAAVSSAAPGNPAAPSAALSASPVAALAADAPPPLSGAPAPSPTAPSVIATPSHGTVFACKSADGESHHAAECGGLPGLDGIVIPRLRKLSECPAAAGTTGSLHLVVRADFAYGLSVELGRSRGTSAPETLLVCAKAALAGASVAGLAHDKTRYSVAYAVAFASDAGSSPDSASAPSPPPPRDAAAQTAAVEWETAIVRDEPKTGKIVARLPRGAAVRLGAIKDGWYPVKFGDGFGSDGWVYRGAVGR